MSGTFGLLLAAAMASATTMGIAAGQATTTQAPNKGEQLMNANCTSCHDLRLIQTQALDKEGWAGVVDAMIQRGAEVPNADLPVLIDYLATNHGPLPEGAGKNIVLNVCTMCHDLSRVRRNLATPEGWAQKLNEMLNEGAPLSEQEFPIVLSYLARNFKPRE